MKKIVLFACAVLVMVSCKKETFTPTVDPVDGSEIQISSATSTKGVTVDYEDNNRNNFFEKDQVGIFLANESDPVAFPYVFTPGTGLDRLKSNRFNVGYEYAEPYWKAIAMKNGAPSADAAAVVERLMFPTIGDKVAKLYAYFPYSEDTKGSTVVVTKGSAGDADKAIVTYKLPVDQSDDATLRIADLMWAKSEGDGNAAGWSPQSAPISLEFNHKMTKLTYKIRIKNHGTSSTTPVVRYVRAVEVKGKNICVDQAAKFQIEDGTLTPDTKVENQGIVYAKFLAENKGLEVKTNKHATGPEYSEPGDYQTLEMLLYPFANQVKNENEFAIYLSKDNTVISDFDAAVQAGTLERYVAVVEAPSGSGDTAKWTFSENRSNVFNLTIDPGDKSINITTKIKAWDAEVSHDIDAD